MMSFYEVLRCLLCDVLRRLEHFSKNDVYSVTFLGRPQKYLSQVFVTFQKYPTKMVLLLVSVGLLQYLIKDVD